MLLRARFLATMTGSPPVEDAGVLIDHEGAIMAAGGYAEVAAVTRAGVERVDLGEVILLPGLINAHCHLDYTLMRGCIPRQRSFTAWIGEINRLKQSWTRDDFLASIQAGVAELRRFGTTTVCNLAAYPDLLRDLPPFPLRTWWMAEMIDLRAPEKAQEQVMAAGALLEEERAKVAGVGLNPHAPYTASPGLYRAAQEAAALRRDWLLTTHLAESRDEEAMFREQSGELATLLANLGRPVEERCGSPLEIALEGGLIGPQWLLAHLNTLDEGDLARLAGSGPWKVVHCPRSHAFFEHPPFRWHELEAAGVVICVGTDSLASNDDLSLWAELRTLQRTVPGLTSESLMETVTVRAARALRQEGHLGVVAPGARADLIAVPYTGTAAGLFDALVATQDENLWMMIDGKLG